MGIRVEEVYRCETGLVFKNSNPRIARYGVRGLVGGEVLKQVISTAILQIEALLLSQPLYPQRRAHEKS